MSEQSAHCEAAKGSSENVGGVDARTQALCELLAVKPASGGESFATLEAQEAPSGAGTQSLAWNATLAVIRRVR